MSVDPATGEVLVSDPAPEEEGLPAIDTFDSTGAFLNKITKGAGLEFSFREPCSTAVNDTTKNIYVANRGEGEGEELGEKEAVFVYTPKEGKFKFEKKLMLDGSNTPAKTFAVGTAAEPEAGGPLSVAVAQKNEHENSEDVYVSVAEQGDRFDPVGVVDQFDAQGEFLKQLPIPARSTPRNMTTDAAGDVYVAVELKEESGWAIVEFNPAGVQINQITGSSSGGFGNITGVAVDAAGHIYASDAVRQSVAEFDAAGRFMGRITGEATPAGAFAEPFGVAVNQQSGAVYVLDQTEKARPNSPSVVDVFAPATAEAEPFLESEGVSSVSATSATLEAQIDPTGLDTSYHFEYAPEGGAFTSIPVADVDIGSGESIQHVSAHLQGLAANTTYEFRAVLNVSGHGRQEGALKAFTTQLEGVGLTLPDHRAWELVSPPNKFGGLIKGIGASGVVQAAADGSRIAYSATSPLEANVLANAGEAPALSVRSGEGWSTREIMPPDYAKTGANVTGTKGLENRAFSTQLTSSLVDPFQQEPLLSPEASELAPYRRDLNDVACRITESTCYTPLVTGKEGFANVPSGVKFGGPPEPHAGTFGEVQVVGTSPDLNHVVVTSGVALTTGVPNAGLYEWTAGKPPAEQLQLVDILPNNEPAAATERPQLGTGITGKENVRHAVSDLGSRIVWSTEVTRHLYMRDTAKGETVQLDIPAEGVEPELPPHPSAVFQTASTDGSKVFFTDEQRLTTNSTASLENPDLYMCQLSPEAGQGGKLGCTLTDLTGSDVVKNSGERGAVQGLVIEASKDGSNVYFVANGVLSTTENAQHEKAVPGGCGENPAPAATCNVYRDHFDGHAWDPTFIAAVSADDGPDWSAEASGPARLHQGTATKPEKVTARVSPNGEYLTFMSDRRLTGYDNIDASPSAAGAADEEVFLYSASANRLVCASCNPSGQRPHGVFDTGTVASDLVAEHQHNWPGRWLAANVPGWTGVVRGVQALYQSRYLSDSGRLFFNSADGLVPHDTNLSEDVYEYEPDGVGSCSKPFGCVALISAGESHEESAFVDASESGGDVFFVTTSKLTLQDVDQSFDIYDAHDCSESPCVVPPAPRPECQASASCQGVPAQQPGSQSPGTATSSVSGNIQPALTQGTLPTRIVKLTRAQQLAKALKACRKLKKHKKRVTCERTAKRKYKAKTANRHAKKSSHRSHKAGK